jgi:ABC-type lipoprotein export system ATPase subunit
LTEGVDSRNASLAALEKTNYGFFSLAVPQISIKKGEMVMIIGQTNSGKSSVLYSMLGEMTSLQSTKYEVKGNMCFMD